MNGRLTSEQWKFIKEITGRLAAERELKGICRKEMADKLGTTVSNVYNFETGRNNSMYLFIMYLEVLNKNE